MFASPFLSSEHWALSAVRKLDALGLIDPGFDAASFLITRQQAMKIFTVAATRAVIERPELAGLVIAYRDRLVEEFPGDFTESHTPRQARMRWLTGVLESAYRHNDGEARAGFRSSTGWVGPVPRPREREMSGTLTLAFEVRPGLTGIARPAWNGNEWTLREGYLAAGWRALGVWAGRRTPGYRPGTGGGIVLDGARAVEGGGVFLADPVTLPGALQRIGPVGFDLFLAQLDANGSILTPWFWGARGTIRPHPRLQLGISRAAMVGGEGHDALTPRDVLYVLIGKHAASGSALENQVVSVDARFRPPLDALPLVLYLEWGFEDSAGAWYQAPGIVAGVEIPAWPGLPEVAVGIEHTAFVPWKRNDGIWYQHSGFLEGWTDEGTPLGHPLGGHGHEWLLHGTAELMNARLRLAARAYTRDRKGGNIFAPEREGRSIGGAMSLVFQATSGVDVIARGEFEDGRSGWQRSAAHLGVRTRF